MPLRKKDGLRFKHRSRFRWILIALVIGVLVLAVFAFISPVSQNGRATPPSPTDEIFQDDDTPEGYPQLTQTAEVDALPPTPEEIGYTDGIIFMSTLLILILLVATLRETLHRRGR